MIGDELPREIVEPLGRHARRHFADQHIKTRRREPSSGAHALKRVLSIDADAIALHMILRRKGRHSGVHGVQTHNYRLWYIE